MALTFWGLLILLPHVMHRFWALRQVVVMLDHSYFGACAAVHRCILTCTLKPVSAVISQR